MAKRKRKRKIQKSKYRLTIDRKGRLRVGGRFATKKQFRALSTRQKKKSVLHKQLGIQRRGLVEYKDNGEFITPLLKFPKHSYSFRTLDETTVKHIINKQIKSTRRNIVVSMYVEGINKYGDKLRFSTKMKDARDDDTWEQLFEDLNYKDAKYGFVKVYKYSMVFSKAVKGKRIRK